MIGQACEFDYSGTQACRVLREEGVRVILVNPNPATIMTDPDFADATYIEPITPEVIESIIAKERPDAVLPTLGGQTALNAAIALHDAGIHLILDNYGTHKTPPVRAWLARHPRFHVHFTPTSASWLNLVERWFAMLTENRSNAARIAARGRSSGHSRVSGHQQRATKPFVWTKTADEILAKVAGFCQRISNSGH